MPNTFAASALQSGQSALRKSQRSMQERWKVWPQPLSLRASVSPCCHRIMSNEATNEPQTNLPTYLPTYLASYLPTYLQASYSASQLSNQIWYTKPTAGLFPSCESIEPLLLRSPGILTRLQFRQANWTVLHPAPSSRQDWKSIPLPPLPCHEF